MIYGLRSYLSLLLRCSSFILVRVLSNKNWIEGVRMQFNFQRFAALMRKETIQILRDRRFILLFSV